MKFTPFHHMDQMLIAPDSIYNNQESCPFYSLPSFQQPALNPYYHFDPQLQYVLSGKSFPLNELDFPLDLIQAHYLNGMLMYDHSILTIRGKPYCTRCGNHEPQQFSAYHCSRCETTCTYCRRCLMMGVVKACTPLIHWTGPPLEFVKHPFSSPKNLELSPLQASASQIVLETMRENKELLIWAVCGAGKTEILFEGIADALTLGKTVAIATPRVDVVHELTPRLRLAFPEAKLISLYGGSDDRREQGQLVITTTHQLLRYQSAFDVMIIDEVDAFPFSMDKTLHYATERAKKSKSSTIYLTATPNQDMQTRIQQQTLHCIKIPKRHHNHPLPVPRFKWIGNWQKKLKKDKLPSTFISFLRKQIQSGRPTLIFVPTIPLAEKITQLIKPMIPLIASIHAEDPWRREKLERFRSRDLHMMVTTTILERGITIPSLDVAVFAAEDWIFTESALVQIAGRVGRAVNDPDGAVIYFHNGTTEAMYAALEHINGMNHLAHNKGID